MVLINEKKFACATCIKGHRVSGCTHTDRPLFEVKKKGRPATQCQHCRDKRKPTVSNNSAVHTKCACGDPKPTNVLLPGAPEPSGTTGLAYPSNDPPANSNSTPTPEVPTEVETKKGQPGSKATFPNGLKDVHEMAAAAEALSTLNTDETMKVAERKVDSLLNPCHCTTGGPCRCCQPKRDRTDSLITHSSLSNGAKTPTGGITEGLSEMFRSKASTTAATPESSSRPSLSVDPGRSGPTWAQLMTPRDNYLSPDNMHHPAHTSRHVHKTKLYSPYSTTGNSTPRHGLRREGSASANSAGPSSHSGWPSSTSPTQPPPPRLRPLSDMNRFLGAVFREDGTVADEIPRSALGLPGIKTFDMIAESGGVKIEPMEVDMDVPISFPTNEDVVIGACTCGENCDCAGCATHGIPPRSGDHSHPHEGGCGENCSSSFDCADHLSLPSGITSIGHLLSIAAANVPQPAQRHSNDLSFRAHDTRVLPPAVQVSEDAARSCGYVTLKPLECCNGRCQCAPGKCVCEKECCGCCIRCACDEDGDTRMSRETTPAASTPMPQNRCSSDTPTPRQPQSVAPAQGSCCSSNKSVPSASSSRTATPPVPSPSITPHNATPPLLSPDAVQPASRQPSPLPINSSTTPTSLRRSSSASQSQASTPTAGRRSTVSQGPSVQRSGSTGKQVSKTMTPQTPVTQPQAGTHAHPRPILPKPSSASSLGPKTTNGSRVPSPGQNGQQSTPGSTRTSPTFVPNPNAQEMPPQQEHFQLPDSAVTYQSLSQQPLDNSVNLSSTDLTLPEVNNEDFMAFIDQLTASSDSGTDNNHVLGLNTSSETISDHALATPDLPLESQQPFDMVDYPTSTMAEMGMDHPSSAMLDGIDTDFMAILTDALATGGFQSPGPGIALPTVPPVPMSQQHVSAQRPSSQQSIHRPSASMYGAIPQSNTLHQVSQAQSRSSSISQQNNMPAPHLVAGEDTGFAINLADPYSFRQREVNRAAWAEPAPVVSHQLPPQYTARLQQMLGGNPVFARQASGHNAQHDGSGENRNGTESGNMIDLSKPLNPTDVERILRALQDQQAHPGAPANGQTPKSGPTLPVGGQVHGTQSRPQDHRASQPNVHYIPTPPLPQFRPMPPQPPPQQQQQQGQGYRDIPPTSYASSEDLFNKFMLANAGLDHSSHIDVGAGGMGMGLNMNDLEQGGMGMGMNPAMGYQGPWAPNGGVDTEGEGSYSQWFQHLTTKGTGI